jgi:hypothetical protein
LTDGENSMTKEEFAKMKKELEGFELAADLFNITILSIWVIFLN